jgi:amino acid transporter
VPTAPASLVDEFYTNFWFGAQTLIAPTLVTSMVISLSLAKLAKLAGTRTSFLQSFCFLLAFSLVGCVSGVVAGWTLESIVGAVLAAVLGLVSSLLTYLFGKETLRAWRTVVPLAIAALLISTLIGLTLGGSRRTQVLNANDEATRAKFEYEHIYAPTELQRRQAIVKRCIDESPNAADAADCG